MGAVAESPRYRPERKFVASSARRDLAFAWLHHVCSADPRHPVGTVNSIYFDTPCMDAFAEKDDGVFLKKKVRLRWYDSPQNPAPERLQAFFEVKNKAGEGRSKSRLPLELDRSFLESLPLDDGFFTALLRDSVPALGERVPAGLEPVIVVSYRRHRFVCPATGARVALDTSITAGRPNARRVPVRGRVSVDRIVLEVKDAGGEDVFWLKTLYSAGFRKRSFSKYGECMSQIMLEE